MLAITEDSFAVADGFTDPKWVKVYKFLGDPDVPGFKLVQASSSPVRGFRVLSTRCSPLAGIVEQIGGKYGHYQ